MVDNAVRNGEGVITLAARTAGEAAVVLTVHDEGPGIPADFLEHTAERFRQGESSRSGRGPGTGLGLSLVDAIATAHGGQLRVCSGGHHYLSPNASPEMMALPCSHPVAGTTVTLLLPAKAAED